MEERLFPKRVGEGMEKVMGMCHYVGAEVTPKNSLLMAFEK